MGGIVLNARLFPKAIILTLLVIFSSCEPKSNFEKSLYANTKYTSKSKKVSVVNDTPDPCTFNFSINRKFPLTKVDILREINNIADEEGISDMEAAWVYSLLYTYQSNPLSRENWQHDPLLYFNSVGSGICDDDASILAGLWQYQGYESKVLGLDGHVTSEVFHNGKWKMLDANKHVYFHNEDGEIASLQELEQSKQLMTKAFYKDNPHFVKKYTENKVELLDYAHVVNTFKNNTDDTEWHIDDLKERDISFTLPSHSSIDFYFCEEKNSHYACINLSEASKGIIRVPLVPMYASSGIEFTHDNISYNTSWEKNFSFIPVFEMNLSDIIINNVEEEAKIYLSINSLIDVTSEDNDIYIQTNDSITVIGSKNFAYKVHRNEF